MIIVAVTLLAGCYHSTRGGVVPAPPGPVDILHILLRNDYSRLCPEHYDYCRASCRTRSAVPPGAAATTAALPTVVSLVLAKPCARTTPRRASRRPGCGARGTTCSRAGITICCAGNEGCCADEQGLYAARRPGPSRQMTIASGRSSTAPRGGAVELHDRQLERHADLDQRHHLAHAPRYAEAAVGPNREAAGVDRRRNASRGGHRNQRLASCQIEL